MPYDSLVICGNKLVQTSEADKRLFSPKRHAEHVNMWCIKNTEKRTSLRVRVTPTTRRPRHTAAQSAHVHRKRAPREDVQRGSTQRESASRMAFTVVRAHVGCTPSPHSHFQTDRTLATNATTANLQSQRSTAGDDRGSCAVCTNRHYPDQEVPLR